jgi:hypothetical protein
MHTDACWGGRTSAATHLKEAPMIRTPTSKLICFGQAKRLTLGGVFNLPPEADIEPRP